MGNIKEMDGQQLLHHHSEDRFHLHYLRHSSCIQSSSIVMRCAGVSANAAVLCDVTLGILRAHTIVTYV